MCSGPLSPCKPSGSPRRPDPTTLAVPVPPSLPKTLQNGGPRGGAKAGAGEGEGVRSGWICGGRREERISELILSRSSLRARVHWARFSEDFGAARDQPSCALRQHPVQLLGITWLGLCSVRGVWCPWEVCCSRDWNS